VVTFQEQELEACKELPDDHSRATVKLMSNLARWYAEDREYEQEEKHLKDLLNHAQQSFGKEHPSTLQVMERIAFY
jgi:hypothetical protein